ncbi:MAG: PLP-dependent transferase, partial [Thermoanaerobaculia bacterium]
PMPAALEAYLDPRSCPAERPSLAILSPSTRKLHQEIDDAARRLGRPYLHPEGPSIQLDMLGSRQMARWQEAKAQRVMLGTGAWSELEQFYARYGVESTRALIAEVKALERAEGAILTDCGMGAVALVFDVLARPGGHAVLARGVYNKTKRYAEWLGGRFPFAVTLVDDGDQAGIESAIRPETALLFLETYSNPLTRAVDPARLGETAARARSAGARRLRVAIDDTIATPWGLKRPLLTFPGIDIVLASGTKALAGQDRDLWGYLASNRIDFLNGAMDLVAMRGGCLDWRRSEEILAGLPSARERFHRRSASARAVAAFLASHPQVDEVQHPSLPDHPDRKAVEEHYTLPGSLIAFRVRGCDEEGARRFADVLATCVVPRYAGSFDGLTTKINHHKSVSEYFTSEEELRRAGIDRVLRLGVGIEEPRDLIACLNWALWHHRSTSVEAVERWQDERRRATEGGDGT